MFLCGQAAICCLMDQMHYCLHSVAAGKIMCVGRSIAMGNSAPRDGVLGSEFQFLMHLRGGSSGLDGFVDSDWGNRVSRRPTTGLMAQYNSFFFGSGGRRCSRSLYLLLRQNTITPTPSPSQQGAAGGVDARRRGLPRPQG